MTRGQWRALRELVEMGPRLLPTATALALVGSGRAEFTERGGVGDHMRHVAATDLGRAALAASAPRPRKRGRS